MTIFDEIMEELMDKRSKLEKGLSMFFYCLYQSLKIVLMASLIVALYISTMTLINILLLAVVIWKAA